LTEKSTRSVTEVKNRIGPPKSSYYSTRGPNASRVTQEGPRNLRRKRRIRRETKVGTCNSRLN